MTNISNSFAYDFCQLPSKYTISTLQFVNIADNQDSYGCIWKFTRFYRIGWLSLQGAISYVVLIYLFRIFTLLVYEGEFTNLFLNCNRLCAGACSVLQHKISSMDCQILSAFIFPIHFLDVSDKYFTQLNPLDNLNLRPVFHQFHNEIT